MPGKNGPTVDLRCSPWTLAQGIDPVGSAVRIDRLLTVEVPQPWPADTGEMPWLGDLDPSPGTRVQAIVAESGREEGTVLVNRWERDGATLVGHDWLLPAGDVPATLAALAAGEMPAGATPAPPEVLVCGHGTRDRCCGGAGTRLAVEVRAALPDLRVRRTSHLGGHRFAPTALTLPDGRIWAHLDADVLAGIVHRTLDPVAARRHYRGNTALDPWAQVVEASRLADEGWCACETSSLDADVAVLGSGDRAEVTLRWTDESGDGSRREIVGVARRYPVLQCGLPPEDATKDACEYAVLTR